MFLKLLGSHKNMQKEFLKNLDFCCGFCNVFESSTALCKVGMATMQMVLCPCTHHYFTPTSWEKSTESFIKISLLVPEIFNVLRYDGFHFYSNSAFMGTKCTHEG